MRDADDELLEPVADEADLLEGGVRTDGGIAHLLADENRPGGWLLTLDRIRQSYVDLDDPTYLDFEYVQGFVDVLDSARPAGERLDATHVGGGAFAFPRFVLHTRPRSSQIVLEPDGALTRYVRQRLPLPKHSGIRVRQEFGRPGVAALADASADLLVLDAYAGGRVPADLTTLEAFTDVARVLRPDGLFLLNLADGPPLDYTRRVLAGLTAVFGHVLVRTDPAVLRPRRFGNLVVAASRAPLPLQEVTRRAHGAPFPTSVVSGTKLASLVGTAKPLTDADPLRSPHPVELAWRVDGGW
ncbi:spermidine synthase [Jatrophihabitans sp. YIM 134969]